MSNHVTIISSDTHAGGKILDYKPYLESRWHDEFEEWKSQYTNPFRDLQESAPEGSSRDRNWDKNRRTTEQYEDGIVAEIVFPNTVPPFFPTAQFNAPQPTPKNFERRLAGLRAHARWLKNFCDELPGQRCGLPQIVLNDIDEAITDVRWAAENGFTSVMIPHVSPDSGLDHYFTETYDPLWAECQELGIVLTQHGGTGVPSYKGSPATPFLLLMEVPFYAQKSMWHLILGGVFQRFPKLKYVMTEQGVSWVKPTLDRMDTFWNQMTSTGRVGELGMTAEQMLPQQPSDYFQQNCWIGASFPAPSDAQAIRELGVDRVMWGSDYPHDEGTYPHTKEALRNTFAGWNEQDLRSVLGHNAAHVYQMDLDTLAPLAEQHGPTIEELQQPLTRMPDNASPAFTRG